MRVLGGPCFLGAIPPGGAGQGAGAAMSAASSRRGAATGIALSPELAEIIRVESRGNPGLPALRHLEIIEERRAQEAECFLRACAVRLRLEGGI